MKSLYTWNWIGGGYNQTHAESVEEAVTLGNAMTDRGDGLRLIVDEKTVRKVEDERSFWKNYPIFD